MKKLFSLALGWVMLIASLVGCSGSNQPTPESTSVSTPTSTQQATQLPTAETGVEFSYPMSGSKSVTYWSTMNLPQTSYKDYTESPFHKGLAANTGVNIKWQFPTAGTDAATAYNLMMASSTLPDIIFYNFADPASLIEDKVIISLNDYMQYAPNLSNFLKENPAIDKTIRTDDGDLYMFPWTRGDVWLCTFRGIAVRADWLKEQNLKVPTNIAELDNVARVFKEKYNAYYSTVNGWVYDGGISTAFDTWEELYVDDNNKVQYGPANDGWREYMKFMSTWYKDGLIDPDFATVDAAILKTKVLNNEVGISYTSGGTVNNWVGEIEMAGSSAEWVGILNPVQKTGDITKLSQMDSLITGGGAAISTSCKDIETAMRVLDYAYSKEGSMYYNFGTEGETYNIDASGKVTFTDLIMKDPDGINAALDKYIGTQWASAAVQDKRMYVEKNVPLVVDLINTWTTNTENYKYKFPKVFPTIEEANAITAKSESLNAYMSEMKFKFIQGIEDINSDTVWNNYLSELNKIGLAEILTVRQAQLDRFNAR